MAEYNGVWALIPQECSNVDPNSATQQGSEGFLEDSWKAYVGSLMPDLVPGIVLGSIAAAGSPLLCCMVFRALEPQAQDLGGQAGPCRRPRHEPGRASQAECLGRAPLCLGRAQAAAASRPLQHCSRCQATCYCCAACQEAHWRASHRWVCKEALPPAAEAAPAEAAPAEGPAKEQPAKKEG
ncbi:ubiquitin carboxyl-terminal hydrolase 18-like [Micractinium conductrix]|uniref:Ubiquitin carboxyl-terminal hydrolase 18-like n=1 Tax=Micractinium conductrix TaxID=554055 RepID=A0A2P6VNS5_9CHLO|nr:ubiquitin carboxyl-terminal hydrolase 18-like [Micractinium conductrix]|eukprot:PSC75730.1 ubiquitin carboxyl-terminal hydrolase 18-like [Micractinium conductrix]